MTRCNSLVEHKEIDCPFNCCFPENELKRLKERLNISLLDCVQSYVRYRRQPYQMYLRMYAKISFPQAVHASGTAVCYVCGRKHPHQRRLESSVLGEFSSQLEQKLIPTMCPSVTSFESLYASVDKIGSSIHGIGPVAIYDTALRISFNLGVPPKDFVYFHGDAVIPGMHGRNPLAITSFKKEFHDCGMTAYEIEDFLCIFHDVLTRFRIGVVSGR